MRESRIRLIRQSKNSFREKKKIKFEEKKKINSRILFVFCNEKNQTDIISNYNWRGKSIIRHKSLLNSYIYLMQLYKTLKNRNRV